MAQLHIDSKTRIVLSVVSILVCFIWFISFFVYAVLPNPRVSPNFILVWVTSVGGASFLILGLCIAVKAEVRHAVSLYLILIAWATGLFVIPVSDGYASEIYGIYFLGLGGIIGLYESHRRKR